MTNTDQVPGGTTHAGPSMPRQRNTSRRIAIPRQTKAAKAAELEKITVLEIASWEGGRKTLSISATISMATAIKLLALADQESKV
jgi:hypothetical protein